jgi:hypothetical protein
MVDGASDATRRKGIGCRGRGLTRLTGVALKEVSSIAGFDGDTESDDWNPTKGWGRADRSWLVLAQGSDI